MNSLRSTVFSGPPSSHLTIKTAVSFTIYQDPTPVEEILGFIDYGYTVTLTEGTREAPNVEEKCLQVTLILTMKDVVEVIKTHEENFSYTIYNSKSFNMESQKLQLIFTRVGDSTGDIILQIYGPESKIKKSLNHIVERTGKEDRVFQDETTYSTRTLVSRETLFEIGLSQSDFRADSTMVKIDLTPYSMLPGYPIEVSSCEDHGCVVNFLLKLTRKKDQMPDHVNLNNVAKFLQPAWSTAPADNYYEANFFVMEDNLPEQSQSKTTKGSKPRKRNIPVDEQETCSVLQLTKKEVTYLIGKSGNKIKQIRELTRANIKVVPINTMNNEQMAVKVKGDANVVQFVRISGGISQVKEAIIIIEKEIYNYRMEMMTH